MVPVNTAPWPSGKAKVCNTSIPGSNPGGASQKSKIQKDFAFFVIDCLYILQNADVL